ncbi:MAG TPA: FAD-binding oxidoreductase, partial [Actinomycetota bacterium]
LDAATQAHGLATSLGVVSETGVAGLTLSGGMGWLRRSHGLSCDNLLAAQVVTADGDVRMATEDSEVDLLWALRGGGGNFGVVTSFGFALHPVGPDVFFCFIFYPGQIAADVLEACIAYMAEAPDEVSPVSFLGRVPAAEAFPPEWHGKPFVAVAGMYVGDPAQGERVFGPLRTLGSPIADLSGTMAFVEAQKVLDEDYPNGLRYYWKSIELQGLGADAIATLMSSAAEMPSGASTIDIWFHGGAMSRVAPEATAFGDRSAPILIGVEANWDDPTADEDNIAWARRCIEDLRAFSSGGSYLNFAGFLEDREQLLRAAYGANYDRLVAVKTTYDPENVFRINQNIPPAAA